MQISFYDISRFERKRRNDILKTLGLSKVAEVLSDLKVGDHPPTTGTIFYFVFAGTVLWHRGLSLIIHAPNQAAMERVESDLGLLRSERAPKAGASMDYEP